MDDVARLANNDRRDLFTETSRAMKMPPGIIEKDFWVCWILDALFSSESWGRSMIFKGGTSLSKVFKCINRFSEDVDLILDWRILGYTDDNLWNERSTTQKDKLFKEVSLKTNDYLKTSFIPQFESELENKLQNSIPVEFQEEPILCVNIEYPRAFTNSYILPVIRLEIGPLAEWVPHSTHTISSFAAETFPNFFKNPEFTIEAIDVERTFWEKATILHQQAMRGYISPRYSRHYYDLAMMAAGEIKTNAFKRIDLLQNVVAFKQQFYPSKSARYELAIPGTMKLLPSENLLQELASDYKKMEEMFYVKAPSFEDIITILNALENEINSVKCSSKDPDVENV